MNIFSKINASSLSVMMLIKQSMNRKKITNIDMVLHDLVCKDNYIQINAIINCYYLDINYLTEMI